MSGLSFAAVPWLTHQLEYLLPPAQAERLSAHSLAQLGYSAEDVQAAELIQLLGLTLRSLKGSLPAPKLEEWTQHLLAELAQQVDGKMHPPKPKRSVEQQALDIARAHLDLAERNYAAMQLQPALQDLEQTAFWEMQASRAEVRRWETALYMNDLRVTHAEQELADQVATVREQQRLYELHIAELEALPEPTETQLQHLDHARLMANQAQHFLKRFTPLVVADADAPLYLPEVPAEAITPESIERHPEVMRRQFDYQLAQWQTQHSLASADVQRLGHELELAKEAAERQLRVLVSQQTEREQLTQLLAQERLQLEFMPNLLPHSAQRAGLRAEWRQLRSAARAQQHQLEEQYALFRCLVGTGSALN